MEAQELKYLKMIMDGSIDYAGQSIVLRDKEPVWNSFGDIFKKFACILWDMNDEIVELKTQVVTATKVYQSLLEMEVPNGTEEKDEEPDQSSSDSGSVGNDALA